MSPHRAGTAAVVVLLAALGATACALPTATTGSAPPGHQATPAAPPPQAPFGQPVTVNGVTVTVGVPTPYTPSPGASGRAARMLRFDVTLANGTNAAVSAMGVSTQATGGGQQLEEVYDSANGVGMATVDVLPGQQLTFPVVFGVPDGLGNIVVQVAPVFGSSAKAYFAGTA